MSCSHDWADTDIGGVQICRRCKYLRPACGLSSGTTVPSETRPWTPERRERVGRAVHAAHQAGAYARALVTDIGADKVWVPPAWDLLTNEQRACYCRQGEAAVRADSESETKREE